MMTGRTKEEVGDIGSHEEIRSCDRGDPCSIIQMV